MVSDERDPDTGKFINFVEVTGTWATELTPAEEVPEESPTDDDKDQEWLIPINVAYYRLFTFERTKLGEYALIYSFGLDWSDPVVVEIVKAKKPDPVHKDKKGV